jgi:hypothetical protein
VLILGGKDRKAYEIDFYNGDNQPNLKEFASLPYIDNLDQTMSAVYWDGCYFLLSNAGVLYKYSKAKKVIKCAKHWIEKTLNIDPPCFGG